MDGQQLERVNVPPPAPLLGLASSEGRSAYIMTCICAEGREEALNTNPIWELEAIVIIIWGRM